MTTWILPVTLGLMGLQSLLMFVDELYYHRRRGLEKGEAWGHAFDTAIFLAAILVPAVLASSNVSFASFVTLGVASTLVVTKDEWIHASACAPGEHWIHSLLFVLHGPLLIGIGYCWVHDLGTIYLKALPLMVGCWGLFQIFYWTYSHAHDSSCSGEQRVLRHPGRPLVSRRPPRNRAAAR